MNILVTTDKNYLQHAYVMLASLLENNPDDPIDIFYLHYDIDDESQAKLTDFFSATNVRVHFIRTDRQELQGLREDFYITVATYLRIFSPDLLPGTVKKILYLDPDMIVKKSLAGLYETDLGKCYLAAVAVHDLGIQRKPALNIPDAYPYFNAGVLLIDVEKFRRNKISEKTLDFARKMGADLIHQDQDALNALLYDKWIALHPRWNVLGEFVRKTRDRSAPVAREIREAMDDPGIIHYTGEPKPWEYRCKNPFREEYWRYLGKTPYRDFKRTGLFRSYSAAIRLSLLKAMSDHFPKSIKDLVPLRLKNMIIKVMLKTDKYTPD